jgi:hypothetical protein
MVAALGMLVRNGFTIRDSTYFYDPPLEGWKNIRDCLFGCMEQLLSLMRVRETAGHHVYLTKRTDR